MRSVLLCIILLAGGSFLQAQVGQDAKDLGHDTKTAAQTGTQKTKNGTKKAYHSSTKAVKKGSHKAANETEKGAGKVADKTNTNTSK